MLSRIQRALGKRFGKRQVSVVRLSGIIVDQQPQRQNSINLQRFDRAIKSAFASNPSAVALQIQSPGGSAAQSAMIVDRVRSLKSRYESFYDTEIPVISFVEDMALSGGYFLACAGDKIVCSRSSLVGSIGVIYSGFGFEEGMEKLGIKRRVHTAGKNKSQLDMFSPEDEGDVKRVKAILGDIHEHFIDVVKTRRGRKLNASDEDLFNGEFWAGDRAIELGLADEIGDIYSYCDARFKFRGEPCPLVPYRPRAAMFLS